MAVSEFLTHTLSEHISSFKKIVGDAFVFTSAEEMYKYGGGNNGLMGAVANASLGKKGSVTGIMPKVLREWEHHHEGITELFIVDTMHTRKKMLYEKCDAAIILPGGYGTLDEVFEMLTWNQLKIHNKKIFFLNSGGFYDHLIAHIDMMHNSGFLYDHPDQKMTVIKEPLELESYL